MNALKKEVQCVFRICRQNLYNNLNKNLRKLTNLKGDISNYININKPTNRLLFTIYEIKYKFIKIFKLTHTVFNVFS